MYLWQTKKGNLRGVCPIFGQRRTRIDSLAKAEKSHSSHAKKTTKKSPTGLENYQNMVDLVAFGFHPAHWDQDPSTDQQRHAPPQISSDVVFSPWVIKQLEGNSKFYRWCSCIFTSKLGTTKSQAVGSTWQKPHGLHESLNGRGMLVQHVQQFVSILHLVTRNSLALQGDVVQTQLKSCNS